MLVRLVRTYLVPYKGELAAILVLQLIGTISALYLPTLNADIIDNGVAKGDTGYIIRTGAWMLGVSVVQIVARLPPSTSPPARRWRWAATCGRRSSTASATSPRRRSSKFGAPTLISRNTNDVTQVQMVVFMALAIWSSAPISMVGGIIMALRKDVACRSRRRCGPAAGDRCRPGHPRDDPAVPAHADLDRQREPDHA